MPINPEKLKTFAVNLLRQSGAPRGTSAIVADSIILSDLLGYHTHGVSLLPLYAKMITDRAIKPAAVPLTRQISECLYSINGNSCFGQLSALEAIDAGSQSASKQGIAAVGISNSSHLGRLGEWAELTCKQDLVFMAFTNTGGGAKNVAPFGGHERKLSTNPVAFGFPSFKALPFNIIVDFATSQVSGSVIREYYQDGRPLLDDWTITESGKPLENARDFMEGLGAILPLGGQLTGHKGFGLAIIAELLGGLAGGKVVSEHQPSWFSNSAIFIFIDPTRFLTREEISRLAENIFDYICNDHVRLPGQGAYQRYQENLEQGISLSDAVKSTLNRLAEELDVSIPDAIRVSVNPSSANKSNFKTW